MGTKDRRRRKKKGVSKETDQKAQKSSPNGPVQLTYFKVFATFKCSDDRCKKSWMSAHAWEREDDEGGIDCEVCKTPAELVNAVDEMLKLDTYHCKCDNFWQSIHVPANLTVAQICDLCHAGVLPSGPPQERFGRHYWLRCMNESCPEKEPSEWEDFSIQQQKTQRCTKCGSRGDILRINKLKQTPLWLRKRQMDARRRKGDPDMEEKPTNHVSEFCDMCQEIRRQGKGKNCRAWRVVKEEVFYDPHTGERMSKIVDMQQESNNPFHYDTKGSQQVLQNTV